ncbi:hypothetical protein BOX15_Mlig001871g2 [Macrostomum lignano]|uniref:EF-hand domain-containing protein n=1 Tax=Macrostomum lignano TaxID=282301 RepID=A0A267H7S7_9PLAT|nr:hypothetical protein BOX15_Mlig001871g2 [Macrostomum lignano]
MSNITAATPADDVQAYPQDTGPVTFDSSTQPKKDIKKPVPPDGKLESRLTTKDLEALQEAFNFKGDSYERLCLNRDQFVQALSIILNKGTDEEYEELFDKIDISKEGSVSWDQLAQHMLLQFYERDDKVKSTQLPQWRDIRMIPAPHKDVIQRVDFLRSSHKYVTVSREGTISLMSTDLEVSRTVRTSSDACKQRDLWVTDFVLLQNVSKVAVGFTSKEIAFYDISSKSDFSCQYRVQDLDASPICLDYWYNPDNANESVLCWGDIKGRINALFFLSAAINLFERQSSPTEDKQETTLIVKLKDIKRGKFKNSNKFISHEAHTDWARQVKYISNLECFISCATTWDDSLVIGWIEKRTTVSNQVMSVKRLDEADTRKVQRISAFQVHQGINAFDYHEGLNLIATAGANNHVCLWNPYVMSKPSGVLTGHVAPVIQVLFNLTRSQVYSFSKDKVLRIWDVQLQVCMQRLAGIFPKGPEVQTRMYMQEDRNRLFLTFNNSLSLIEMKAEVKDRVLSHDRSVTSVIFSWQLNQLLTACQGSNLSFWLIDTGQRLRQTPNAHGDAEITTLANDPAESRFYSGGTDGIVRIWDWNGHMYHELDCNRPGVSAEISQILVLKHSLIACGFSKDITVFRTNSFRDIRIKPGEWRELDQHRDDILAAAYCAPHYLITASYDGMIAVWNISSEVCTRKMRQRCSTMRRQASSSAGSGERRRSARSDRQQQQDMDSGFTISRLRVLANRKAKAKQAANLVSCGANGIVRFWNLHQGCLVAEFLAHKQASSIIMDSSPQSDYLATADGNGCLKVWHIAEYCTGRQDQSVQREDGEDDGLIIEPPSLETEWQAHPDQINDLEFAERQDRLLILTASSDCSVSLWDILGNLIGIFGQEEHWKIEHLSVILERLEREKEDHEVLEAEPQKVQHVSQSNWQPDEQAIADPNGYRITAWNSSLLGSSYIEAAKQKRQRRQPEVMTSLPFLTQDRHTPSIGPFNNLDIASFAEARDPKPPDFVSNPDAYFRDRDHLPPAGEKTPVLAETLKAAFDDRSLFPKYILDYESQMKKYQNFATNTKEKDKGEISAKGSQLSAPGTASHGRSDLRSKKK